MDYASMHSEGRHWSAEFGVAELVTVPFHFPGSGRCEAGSVPPASAAAYVWTVGSVTDFAALVGNQHVLFAVLGIQKDSFPNVLCRRKMIKCQMIIRSSSVSIHRPIGDGSQMVLGCAHGSIYFSAARIPQCLPPGVRAPPFACHYVHIAATAMNHMHMGIRF